MAQIITRRTALAAGSGLAAAGLVGARASAVPVNDTAPPNLPIETGASLRVLRPTKFVDNDETIFRDNLKRFTNETKVPVQVDFSAWEDLRPQTAVAANTGSGADIIVGWPDDPHIYADSLVEVTDIAEYLGRKYGGWYFLAEKYGKRQGTNDWLSIPMGGSGAPVVYRRSWVKEAGFDGIPTDFDQFLALCRELKKNGHPAGFALGNSVGDANGYCNWMLWGSNACLADEGGRVAINSRETIEALNFARAMYPTMIEGTISWLDSNNNKAYLNGDIGMTANGVSIYYALKRDPRMAAVAADTEHAPMPTGKFGQEPQSALILNAMVLKYTRYPNAAKQLLRFMMEQPQYEPWLAGTAGYWAQSLKAYAESDVWRSDPKLAAYRDTCGHPCWNGYKGPITSASGAVTADYVVVQMFAAAASGQATPEAAAAEGERRAKRYYRG